MALTIAKENQTRMARCDEHAWDYPQTFFPPPVAGQEGHWAGECPKCAADRELSERANAQLLAEYGSRGIAEKIRQRLALEEDLIADLAAQSFNAYLDRAFEDAKQNLYSAFEAAAYQQRYEFHRGQEEESEFEQIVSQLREMER